MTRRPPKPRKPIRHTVIKRLQPVRLVYFTIFCAECGRAKMTPRRNTITCSDACRSRRYRRIKKERQYMIKMQQTEPLFDNPLDDDPTYQNAHRRYLQEVDLP